MYARRHHFEWLRENIEAQLSRIDQVIAAVVPASIGGPGVTGDEPWLQQLFERRQRTQSTLFDLEQQIENSTRNSAIRVYRLQNSGDDR